MSNAARKVRKREQREAGEKYQHPTREGVPYGRSKQPNLDRELAESHQQAKVVGTMLAASRDYWGRAW